VIANDQNVGYAVANNQGMAASQGRYILILNPDTILQEDTLDVLTRFLDEHPDTGAVGPKVIFPIGTFDYTARRSFPTPWVSFCKLSGLSKLFPNSPRFAQYNLTYVDPDVPMEVDSLCGACMMIRREIYENIGGFDEDYFMYGEDIDWCYRIKQAGWKVQYYPKTQIIHYKGESTKRSTIKRNKYFYGAMHLFVRKHFQYRLSWLLHPILDVAIAFRGLIAGIGKLIGALAYPAVDFFLIVCAVMLARYLRFQDWRLFGGSLTITLIYGAIWLGTFTLMGIYQRHRHDLNRVVIATALGFVLNSTFTYFVNQFAYSRLVVLISSFMLATLLPGWRWALLQASRTLWGRALKQRITLIVGIGNLGRAVVEKLRAMPDKPYDVVGMVSYGDENWDPKDTEPPVLGHVRDLDLILAETQPEEVIFSTESVPYEEIFKTISSLSHRQVNFKVVHGDLMRSSNGYIPLLDVEYRRKRGFKQTVNRAMKIIFS
jgi:GT2 family glycosyltransferase